MVKPFRLRDYNMEIWNQGRSEQTFRGFRTGRPGRYSRRRATPYAIKSASKIKTKIRTSSLETWINRLGKILVTLTCAGSCMYFLINFFLLYWEYQTVVNVTIDFPETPDLPGITVCVENLKKRVNCETNTEDLKFCDEIKQIVRNTKSTEFQEFLASRRIDEIKNMAPTTNELFISCKLATEVDDRDTDICNNSMWLYYRGSNCYAMWTKWYSAPEYTTLHPNDSEFHVILGHDPDQYYNTENLMIADVFVHGRKGLPDLRTPSFEANPGDTAYVGITVISVELMEPPYKTMCKLYNNSVSMNNVNVLSEDLCLLECSKVNAITHCNCIPNCLQLTEPKNKCEETIQTHRKCCGSIISLRPECHRLCPADCWTQLYDIAVDVDKGFDFEPLRIELNNSEFNNTLFSKIAINLQAVRHIKYSHGARITPIEILGYVGGYLGIWLGVSIPWIYDSIVNGLNYLRIISTIKNHGKKSSAKSISKFTK